MATSITQLEEALSTLRTTTNNALTTSQSLSRRTRHLSTLTSPASETSSSLTQASTNLTSTLALLRDAREKFDTVADCEPSIERLYRGAKEMVDSRDRREHPNNTYNIPNDSASLVDNGGRRNFYDDDATLATLNGTVIGLTEQDVYAAADSLEIIRDAHAYFLKRPSWKSSKAALTGLERVHQLGVDGMCNLIHCHFMNAGPAFRAKRAWGMLRNADDATVDTAGENSTIATNTTFGTRQGVGVGNPHARETARDTRQRLSAALQNRDLMKSVGEHEESLPLDTRTIRELRAIFECLGGIGCFLETSAKSQPNEIMKRLAEYQVAAGKVSRTEKIGSGHYTKLTMKNYASGYSHLDAYSEARRVVAYQSMQVYYKKLRTDRKKEWDKRAASGGNIADNSGELDASARDAVRCLEHAMVIVAGEKSIYRCVISPTSSHTHDSSKIPIEYKYALVAAYSNVCGVVVDRVLDIIELFFVKDAALRNPTSKSSSSNQNDSGLDGESIKDGIDVPSVRFAASAAAAGLRILDAVRMLGPSLAKLCEMANDKMQIRSAASSAGSTISKANTTSLASNLCIAIHRMTVKNAGKALENLAIAAKRDPLDGEKYRPRDGRVAAISSDVVRAIRIVSPFVNAYKSVTKRRQLPWDPKIGAAAGEMEFFIRYLVMTLLANLQAKAVRYTKDPDLVAQAKSYLFLMNNTFYLSEQLSYNYESYAPILRNNQEAIEGDDYKIRSEWFTQQVNKLFEHSKKKYLQDWDALNKHLVTVQQSELSYTNSEQNLLTLESGRVLKARFSGFNDEFEKTYSLHKELTIMDTKLREKLVEDVKAVFLPKYRDFYDVYSKYQFSKKNMVDYLKYPPAKVETMMTDMFSSY